MKQSIFRSIRRKLLDEGKLVRYLTYAIGEVILIIAGILFALKINDWNEDKKAQVEFDLYIVQLKEDLQLVIERMDEAVKDTAESSQNIISIIQYLEGHRSEDLNQETFEDALRLLRRINTNNVRVGYLGRLLEGDFDTIERNHRLGTEALHFQSRLQSRLGIIQRIMENREIPDEIVRRYYEGPIRLLGETEMIYDLDRMKSSEEFRVAVRAIVRSKNGYQRHTLLLIQSLKDFLAVLEEYETP